VTNRGALAFIFNKNNIENDVQTKTCGLSIVIENGIIKRYPKAHSVLKLNKQFESQNAGMKKH
jgi:hypothetical protein